MWVGTDHEQRVLMSLDGLIDFRSIGAVIPVKISAGAGIPRNQASGIDAILIFSQIVEPPECFLSFPVDKKTKGIKQLVILIFRVCGVRSFLFFKIVTIQ